MALLWRIHPPSPGIAHEEKPVRDGTHGKANWSRVGPIREGFSEEVTFMQQPEG